MLKRTHIKYILFLIFIFCKYQNCGIAETEAKTESETEGCSFIMQPFYKKIIFNQPLKNKNMHLHLFNNTKCNMNLHLKYNIIKIIDLNKLNYINNTCLIKQNNNQIIKQDNNQIINYSYTNLFNYSYTPQSYCDYKMKLINLKYNNIKKIDLNKFNGSHSDPSGRSYRVRSPKVN